VKNRRGWIVYRTVPDTNPPMIADVVRVFVGTRAEASARFYVKDQKQPGRYAVCYAPVVEHGPLAKEVYKVRRLPMGQSFDDLEIVASSCVMGTLTSIRVQTPDGVVYRTPLTSSLRSELNRLRSVKGTRLRAVSHGYKRVIHEFEITRAASSALAQQTEDR